MNQATENSGLNTKELLLYWIRERYAIHSAKDLDRKPKPWTKDPVFRTTYFCNVHREDDKVTKFIREMYEPHSADDMFIYNAVLARFINWPPTLAALGYLPEHMPERLVQMLTSRADSGKQVWGNAYLITSNGMAMPKPVYLAYHILGPIYADLPTLRNIHGCATMADRLQRVRGIGTFLAGQIVADLKNSIGQPLFTSYDKYNFVVPGVGSLRGASWFHYGKKDGVKEGTFPEKFKEIRAYVDEHWPKEVPPVDNQDLQNVLCEFDKFMRVKTGSGKSKRGYNG